MTYDATDADSDGVVEADVDNQSVSTDALSLTPVLDETVTFSSGETRLRGITSPDAELGDRIIVSATPDNDPDNDHGYSVDSVKWVDSASAFQARITETESSGGGDARITAWVVGV